MRILDNKDRLGSLFILAFSIVYLRYALVLPTDPLAGEATFTARTLPVGLAIAAIGFCLLQLTLSINGAANGRVSDAVRGYRWRPPVLLVAAMTAYALLFDLLGFVIASFLFLGAGFLILGERRLMLAGAVAGGLVLCLWMLLTLVFGIHLDGGAIVRLFDLSAS